MGGTGLLFSVLGDVALRRRAIIDPQTTALGLRGLAMKRSIVLVALLSCCVLAAGVAACGGLLPTTSTTIIATTTTTEPPAVWKQAQPSGVVPSARCYTGMAYDPSLSKVIVFAGFDGTSALRETWAYDPLGSVWSRLEPTGDDQPSGAGQIPAVYDFATRRIIAFDGTTWTYYSAVNAWEALNTAAKVSPALLGGSLAYDSTTGKVFLFGGTDKAKVSNETWLYDPVANNWSNLNPVGEVPPGRSDAGMAYDPTSGKIVLFGGVDSGLACLNDTWSYDPASNRWTKLSPPGAPVARSGHGMAYDPHTKTVILFGGIDSDFVCHDDTWAYDPVEGSWTELTLAGDRPQARGRSVLVYASSIDKLVLFGGTGVQGNAGGGFGSPMYLSDTWIYGIDR
jgi:hypothetical protein